MARESGTAQHGSDSVGRTRSKVDADDEDKESVHFERAGQASGLPFGIYSTGVLPRSATSTVPGDLVSRQLPDSVRCSPLAKQRSKSNDEKATSERNRSALKPRSVSADDRPIDHGSIRQGVTPPSNDERQPMTVIGSGGGEQDVARGVDRSVVIRNTAYRGTDSSQHRERKLDMQTSLSVMNSGGNGSAEAGRTGVEISSVNQNESQSTVDASTTDVTRTSFAASVSAKSSAAVDGKAPERLGVRLRPKVPPKPSRPKMDESGLAMVATVSLKHGLEVPVSTHGLQLRVKDEIKIVTATRRLRLDEAEEIRILEAEFAVRSKERKLKAGIRLNRPAPGHRGSWSDEEHQRTTADDAGKERCCGRMEEMMNYEDLEGRRTVRSVSLTPSTASAVSKQSKRPTSDPMFAKFSPIDEDGDDAEGDVFLSKTLPDVGRSYTSLDKQNATPPIRLGTAVLTGGHKIPLSESPRQMLQPFLSRSTLVLHSGSLPESSSLGSLSATSLSFADHKELAMILADNDDARGKEERLQYLQTEIEKRRKHLSEVAQRGGGAVLNVRESFAPKSDSRGRKDLEDSPDLIASRHTVNSRLIKPIDYQINPENYYVRSKTGTRQARVDARTAIIQSGGDTQCDESSVYSSFEYLTHKTTENAQKNLMLPEKLDDPFPADVTVYQSQDYGQLSFAAPIEKDIIRYSESEDSLLYCPANYGSSRDSGVSSNMTGPDVYAFRSDHENTPPQDDFRNACCYPTVIYSSASMHEYYQQREGSAATPAMPLLGDVTSRSRSLLRDIGSRPLSDDLEKYFQMEG